MANLQGISFQVGGGQEANGGQEYHKQYTHIVGWGSQA